MLENLKGLTSLRDLHLWFLALVPRAIRITPLRPKVPKQGRELHLQASEMPLHTHLQECYPPNLQRLAHTNSAGLAAADCVYLWRTYTFNANIVDTLHELAGAVERLPNLTRLALPHIPRDQWLEARARVLRQPKLENWLAGVAFGGKSRRIMFKLYD